MLGVGVGGEVGNWDGGLGDGKVGSVAEEGPLYAFNLIGSPKYGEHGTIVVALVVEVHPKVIDEQACIFQRAQLVHRETFQLFGNPYHIVVFLICVFVSLTSPILILLLNFTHTACSFSNRFHTDVIKKNSVDVLDSNFDEL